MGKFLDWLNEKEGKESEYQIFFRKKLEKYNVKSASELSKEDKMKFFDEIEKEWTGDEEDVKKSKEESEQTEKEDVNESADKIIEELLKDVNSLYEKFNKAEQKVKIFSQSKLTEVKVKLMDLLEK